VTPGTCDHAKPSSFKPSKKKEKEGEQGGKETKNSSKGVFENSLFLRGVKALK
jgi:hypothetical protein